MKRLSFLFLFLILLSLPQSSLAQQQRLEIQGLAITPFLIEVEGNPGKKTDHSIVITNTTNQPLPIRVSVNDFIPTEGGQPRFLDSDRLANEQYSLAKWVTITGQPNFTIPANQSTEIKFSITPPENAEPGTHYGGILFSYVVPKNNSGNSQVEHKVGAIILNSLGKGSQQGKITELYQTTTGNKDIDFSITFNNFGNTHVVPKGDIVITDSFGRIVGTTAFNKDGLVVLPETQRSFPTTWHSEGILFGRYTFTAIAYFGNPKLESQYAVSVWILPVKLILLNLGILICIVIVAIFAIKRYNKYIISKHHTDIT